MKKMFFFAAVAGVAFASCTKDVEAPVSNVADDKDAIVFQLGKPLGVSVTRGKGAVGSTEAERNNTWNGEQLNVYMFDKGTLSLAQEELPDFTKVPYFENTVVTAPFGEASAEANYGDSKYFPSSGNFDFFAYHGDDAVVGNPALNPEGDAYIVSVEIDGTQDLMVAKAALNDDDRDIINQWNADNSDKPAFTEERAYSAYAARRGVNPRLTFKHLLSRFVFQAVISEQGDLASKENLFITGIEVEAPYSGIMTVASQNTDLGVAFEQEQLRYISLNDQIGEYDNFEKVELFEGHFKSEGVEELNVTRLGESLLLPAGAEYYNAKIHLAQYKNGKDKDPIVNTLNATFSHPTGNVFEAGTQYKINITVYGFEEIKLTADLEAWKEGEDIPFDGE